VGRGWAERLPDTRSSEDGPNTHLAPAVAFFFAAGGFFAAVVDFAAGFLAGAFETVVFGAAGFFLGAAAPSEEPFAPARTPSSHSAVASSSMSFAYISSLA